MSNTSLVAEVAFRTLLFWEPIAMSDQGRGKEADNVAQAGAIRNGVVSGFILRSGILECVILIFLGTFVISSVAQVSSRQSAVKSLDALEQQLSADFSEANSVGVPLTATSDPYPVPAEAHVSGSDDKSRNPETERQIIFSTSSALDRKQYIHSRNIIRYARSQLEVLDHNGGPLDISALLSAVSTIVRTDIYSDMPLLRNESPNWMTLNNQPSDTLFAIVATFSGGIGSLIAGLRRKETTAFRDVLLGLASGFVVFVIILGGKYVFLLQQGEVPLNPYGFALSALLSGLFSERAFGLLTAAIDVLERKVKDAIK